MNFYRWTALNTEKIHQHGIEPAASASELTTKLKSTNLTAISVRKLRTMPTGSLPLKRWLLLFLNRWVALNRSGYDQLQAFLTMQRQSTFQQEAAALQHICTSIQKGRPVSVAMARHTRLFPGFVRQQIGVAEQTGQYSRILPLITSIVQRQISLQQEVRQQLRYPLTVLVVALILMSAMQLWVLPAFANVYEQMNIPLPALTQAVLNFAGPKGGFTLLALLLVLVLVFFLCTWVIRHGFSDFTVSKFVYRTTPALLVQYRHLLRDLETLHTNLLAGLALAPACILTSRYSQSRLWSLTWLRASIDIQQGLPLHKAVARHALPGFVIDYIETGELAGQLPDQLELAIAQLKSACDGALQLLCKAIPGIMLGLVAVVATTILLAVYVPLFQLGGWVG